MRKQTQKEIWYWMVMGTSILIILAFAYARKDSHPGQKENLAKKETPQETAVKPGQESGVETHSQESSQLNQGKGGGGQEPKYYWEVTGGQIAQNYLLKDAVLQDYPNQSWFLIYLEPQNYSKLPRYTGRSSNQKITLTLTDTADFDITSGRSSYQGKYSLAGKGIIKGVKVIRSSGAKMDFELTLTKSRPFRIDKMLNPLRLVVKVKK